MSRKLSQKMKDLGVELIRCEECSYFRSKRTGKRGGVYGKCELKDDLPDRSGKRVVCRFYKMKP